MFLPSFVRGEREQKEESQTTVTRGMSRAELTSSFFILQLFNVALSANICLKVIIKLFAALEGK